MLVCLIKQNISWCYEKIFGYSVVGYNGIDVVKKRFLLLKNAFAFSERLFLDYTKKYPIADVTVFNRKYKHIADFFRGYF